MFATRGYDTIHLLTFDNGAQSNLDLCEIKIPKFQEQFPNTEFKHVKNLLLRYNLSTKSLEGECMLGGTFSRANPKTIRKYFEQKTHFVYEYIESFLNEMNHLETINESNSE
jgi:hypothetical protein